MGSHFSCTRAGVALPRVVGCRAMCLPGFLGNQIDFVEDGEEGGLVGEANDFPVLLRPASKRWIVGYQTVRNTRMNANGSESRGNGALELGPRAAPSGLIIFPHASVSGSNSVVIDVGSRPFVDKLNRSIQ